MRTAKTMGNRLSPKKSFIFRDRLPRKKKNTKTSRTVLSMSSPHQIIEDRLEVVIRRCDLLHPESALQDDLVQALEEDVPLVSLDNQAVAARPEMYLQA